jgi:hypothetical protein
MHTDKFLMIKSAPKIAPRLNEWLRRVAPEIWSNPPIDLDKVSDFWGVSTVIKRPLDRPGLLHQMEDGRLIIVLNEDEPLVRQRFTWAHELGHIVMAGHDSVGISCIKTGEVDKELERCCDAIAAEILMPIGQFSPAASESGWELTAVNNLAKRFQVSLESAAIRMNHLRDEPIVMSVWYAGKQPLVALDHRWALPNNAAKELKPVIRRNNSPDAMKPILEAFHSSQLATGSCKLLVKSSQKSASRTFKWVPTDALGVGRGRTRKVLGYHYLSRNH